MTLVILQWQPATARACAPIRQWLDRKPFSNRKPAFKFLNAGLFIFTGNRTKAVCTFLNSAVSIGKGHFPR